MPKYQCPECEAILKRDTAVEEGKKIKCPKCEVVFRAKAMRETREDREEEEKKKAKAAEKKKTATAGDDDEEDEGGSYDVAKEQGESEDARKKDLYFGSLRDKFEKSKRGPAMAETVRPSNLLIFGGFCACVQGLALVVIGLWPFIFSEDIPRGGDARNKILLIIAGVICFAIGCLICHGAAKMQNLESITWAWVGTILAILFGNIFGLAGGIWAATVLRDEDVIAGFEETQTMKDF